MPKVSVIIPVYNAEKFLQECLDSVIGQTLTDIEIVVVNDGSTDSSPQILQSYAEQDERIIVIHQKNKGVAAARNHAMEQACGEFICFMDPDDFYPNNETLNLLYSKAKANHAYICGGSFSEYRNGVVVEVFYDENKKYSFSQEGFVNYRDYQFDYGYHRFLYNREFLEKHHIIFPPYKRFQDPPFMVKAMLAAKQFYAVPNIVYRYRIGHQLTLRKWPAWKLRDMLRGYLEIMALSKAERLEELHARTVWRLERDYVYKPVMKVLHSKDEEMLMLVVLLNSEIDTELLQQAGVQVEVKGYYVIRELRSLLKAFSESSDEFPVDRDSAEGVLNPAYAVKSVTSTTEGDAALRRKIVCLNGQIKQLQDEILAVQNSWTYRIGRFITWIPRKIRKLIHN